MKVYIAKQCYYNGCDIWTDIVKIFDDELKALLWVEENFTEDENEWREYEEIEVE